VPPAPGLPTLYPGSHPASREHGDVGPDPHQPCVVGAQGVVFGPVLVCGVKLLYELAGVIIHESAALPPAPFPCTPLPPPPPSPPSSHA
jgi:hypothetical protein